jgi:hypothetical protein
MLSRTSHISRGGYRFLAPIGLTSCKSIASYPRQSNYDSSPVTLQKRGLITGAEIGTYAAYAAGSTLLPLLAWASTRYKVAEANEYICRTGLFIDDIDISKQAFLFPYQTISLIKMEPVTYSCVIEEAMSAERISFNLPTVFTVGPTDNKDSLKIYAKLLQGSTPEDLHLKISGIIQGETRMAVGM